MSLPDRLGGVIHVYQKYDPVNFPSPTAPPPDMVSPLFDHLLMYGDTEEFTEEQLANAIRLDASQIAGLGPSLQAIKEMLLERKRKILETYETMDVPKALEVKEELETIDKLLKQIEEAKKTAQLAIIDLDELEQFAAPGDLEKLQELQQQIENYIREQAEKQGLEGDGKGKFRL